MACWRLVHSKHWRPSAILTKKPLLGSVYWCYPQLWFLHLNSESSCLNFTFFRVVANGDIQENPPNRATWARMPITASPQCNGGQEHVLNTCKKHMMGSRCQSSALVPRDALKNSRFQGVQKISSRMVPGSWSCHRIVKIFRILLVHPEHSQNKSHLFLYLLWGRKSSAWRFCLGGGPLTKHGGWCVPDKVKLSLGQAHFAPEKISALVWMEGWRIRRVYGGWAWEGGVIDVMQIGKDSCLQMDTLENQISHLVYLLAPHPFKLLCTWLLLPKTLEKQSMGIGQCHKFNEVDDLLPTHSWALLSERNEKN